jgi:hypothetical protein
MTTATVKESVASYDSLKRVRGYERKFGGRRRVLDEVTRLLRERRVPLASRDASP